MSDVRIGVIGAGVMGSGIAQVAGIAGYPTVCFDIDAAVVERAHEHATSDETVARIEALAAACDKNPVVVKDTDTAWGFVANRVYAATMNEAKRVVDEGIATPEQVDQLMMDCFGWPTGPYTMIRGALAGWT
jgi:3-hydroxybutyryl-CoA dehydrogenase/3-hydroxyacyl-CoA dehydrogenase